MEGALFSTSNCDTSLAALNSKLASSAPRGITLPAIPSQNTTSQPPLIKPQASGVDEKNIFAIYVSYYIKVKLTLSGMGGEVTLKLPFILGNIENIGQNNDKTIPPNHTNDLHLNDHQTLNEIRRPRFNQSDSTDKEASQLDMLSRKGSIVCKSIDLEDEDEIVPDLGSLSETKGIAIINRKLCELNQNDFGDLTRSDSSKSSLNVEVNNVTEICAQVHSHKSDDNV